MSAPVPQLLRGAWKRHSIVNADGSSDTTSTVLWLQLESSMVDVRLPSDLSDLTLRGSLDDCDLDDLGLLAACEASTGYTTCTKIEEGDKGLRSATAEWITRGPSDIAIHPVTSYPEPGHLEWNGDGSVMVERAPSGAYVEEWHRIADTDSPLAMVNIDDRCRLYVAGNLVVRVRGRSVPLGVDQRLDVLIDQGGIGSAAILFDCEFSIAQRYGPSATITESNLPWLKGEVFDVGL